MAPQLLAQRFRDSLQPTIASSLSLFSEIDDYETMVSKAISIERAQERHRPVRPAPDGLENLFSLRTAIRRLGGPDVTGWNETLDGGRLTHNGEFILTATTRDLLLVIENKRRPNQNTAMTIATSIPIQLAHDRLGHISARTIRSMASNGLTPSVTGELGICEACQLGKSKRQPAPKIASRTTSRPLEIVSMDLHIMSVPARDGTRYLATWVDSARAFSTRCDL
jgi:hypothetical protein